MEQRNGGKEKGKDCSIGMLGIGIFAVKESFHAGLVLSEGLCANAWYAGSVREPCCSQT